MSNLPGGKPTCLAPSQSQAMTPPMPTDTPSAGAEAMARRYFDSEFSSLAACLDAFARERCDSREWQTAFRAREAAVWEEAIKIADTVRDQDIAAALRTRAAEARRTG